MNNRHLLQSAFIIIGFVILLTACTSDTSKSVIELEDVISQAFELKMEASKEQEIVFMLFEIEIDNIEIAEDQQSAEIWFAMLDPQTGLREGTEPGVALAFLVSDNPYTPGSWKIVLHHEDGWQSALWSLPETLMSTEEKSLLQGKTQSIPHDAKTFTGYKLPFPEGRKAKLSQSIGHVLIYKTCPSTCLYAFDFWDGTMFPVSAARGGVVKKAIWEFPNGNTTNTNYLLIEDTSTSPTTYQIYYHLAQDSIPPALRVPGAAVRQGQFIGNADDTGASTAHHLHFMVHTNPSSYWGTSVDITFDEVSMNGGRPRTCIEAEQFPEYGSQCVSGDWFVSKNADAPLPTASIVNPSPSTLVNAGQITVSARADSPADIKTLTFYFRQKTSTWQAFDVVKNSTAGNATLNFCDWGLENGSIDLAVGASDSLGKMVDTKNSPTTIHKNFACEELPPSPCSPAPDQIALFTDFYYQGECTRVKIGEYPSMDYVAGMDNDRVRSILVGNDALAVLFVSTNLKGAQESFRYSDPDLSDNPTGIDTVSSLRVINFPDAPQELFLPQALSFHADQVIEFAWMGDADIYRAEIIRNDEILNTRDWHAEANWVVGTLEPGQYRLNVVGSNPAGAIEASADFTVMKSAGNQPVTRLEPLPALLRANLIHLQWSVEQGSRNVRWFEIQMKIDGGEWQTLDRIQPDARSLTISGSPGSIYEFRLRAAAIDGSDEPFPGVTQAQTTLDTTCSPDSFDSIASADSHPQGATRLSWFTNQGHNICGAGDVDWIQLTLTKGQRIRLAMMPEMQGLELAGSIFLDADLSAPLVEFNDHLTFRAPATGTYLINVKAVLPLAAGTDATYSIRVVPMLRGWVFLILGGMFGLIIGGIVWLGLHRPASVLGKFFLTMKKKEHQDKHD